MGVVFLARDGGVTHLNPSAQYIATQSDGLFVAHGRLRAVCGSDTILLDRMVASASGRGKLPAVGGSMLVARPSGMRPMHLVVSPLPRADESLQNGRETATVAVFMCGHKRQMTCAREILMPLYGLSSAEARVAAALLEGKTLAQISEEASFSRNTAKTQLASLFAKTRTHRRSNLLSVLAAAVCNVRAID